MITPDTPESRRPPAAPTGMVTVGTEPNVYSLHGPVAEEPPPVVTST